jgi:hypothetical protein
MRLVLPVSLAVSVDGSRRALVQVGIVHLLDSCGRVGLHDLPTLAVVQLHPVVLAVFNLSGALQCLGEELAEVVVVGGILESEVANITEVLVEFLCIELVLFSHVQNTENVPGKLSHRSLMGVVCFFSPIFSYFCLLVAAFRPCHGSPPRRKYMKT